MEVKVRQIAVTGLSGVIGKVLEKDVFGKSQFIDLYHKEKFINSEKISKHIYIDLASKKAIDKALFQAKPDVIVHLAAITHIDACEVDRKNGDKGLVWKVNVEGTRELANYCASNKIPLVLLSTECVFDGRKKYFSEDDTKNPINWYGETKSEAENAAVGSGAKVAIIRSVVAYHKKDNGKTIYGKILKKLKSGQTVEFVSDQLFTPTYTYDIVRAIHIVIENELQGIYHVVPARSISPYEFARIVAIKNKIPLKLVRKINLVSLYGDRKAALRLKNSSLNGRKSAQKLKFRPRSPQKLYG